MDLQRLTEPLFGKGGPGSGPHSDSGKAALSHAADAASGKAYAATQRAERRGSSRSHARAAGLHEQAAEAHDMASDAHSPGQTPKAGTIAAEHDRQSTYHRLAATAHESLADKVTKMDMGIRLKKQVEKFNPHHGVGGLFSSKDAKAKKPKVKTKGSKKGKIPKTEYLVGKPNSKAKLK